ncbi:MAG TPA: hypothetical protein VMU94_02195 [Streptosporangiaceae bacterium]|nr:hypothetical protein [Streptosporangiaceae bacterium]
MTDQLLARYQAVRAAASVPAGEADMTVVLDAGQNSAANFARLAGTQPWAQAGPDTRRAVSGRIR